MHWPLKELAGPGKSVVIVIPDIVKGGNQPTSHRKVAIRACLDELYAAGVEQKDVLLLFSNGLHPRIVFMKSCLEGKKYLEIAEELRISVNTVKSHISKAYREIRGKIAVLKNSNLLLLIACATYKEMK